MIGNNPSIIVTGAPSPAVAKHFLEAGRRAGCPSDQIQNLYAAEIILQIRQLATSAAARLCDQPAGPRAVEGRHVALRVRARSASAGRNERARCGIILTTDERINTDGETEDGRQMLKFANWKVKMKQSFLTTKDINHTKGGTDLEAWRKPRLVGRAVLCPPRTRRTTRLSKTLTREHARFLHGYFTLHDGAHGVTRAYRKLKR